MNKVRRLTTATAVAMALAVLSLQASAQAAETTTQIDLPAQPLAQAIQAVARQASINILVDPRLVEGREAPAVKAEMSIQQALNVLLQGTGLTPRYVDDKTITLVTVAPIATKTSADMEATNPRLAQNTDSTENQTSQKSDSSAEESDNKLQEIVVTAQKRTERLQNVPISISVLRGDDLDRSNANITEQLNRLPGVSTIVSANGGDTQLAVRGVTASGTFLNGSSPIAYYLDSVPFGLVKTSIVPDISSYDLDRVEALRGPQGTLYGASALNGVVRVLTKDANLDNFELKARTSASSTQSGGGNYRGDLAINAPIAPGKLAARAVVGYESLSGWIDRPNDSNANGGTIRNARFKINARPSEALSIALSASLSRSAFDAPPSAPNDRTNPNAGEPIATDYDAYGLKIGYDFPAFSVSSMTSYLDYSNDGTLDFTSLGLSGVQLSTGLGAHAFTQEVTLNSTHGRSWRWSVGGIYRDGADTTFQNFNVPILPAPVDFTNTSKSYAVFGELTRLLLDGRFEATIGLRHFEDDVGQHENVHFGAPTDPLIRSKSKFSADSPRAVLTFHPNGQMTIYTSYAQGFRSGFDQTTLALLAAPGFPAVKPDKLKNYELGAKGGWLEGRIDFDAAMYYIDWQDVMQTVGVPYAGTSVLATINGSSASGIGAEFAVMGRPIQGLELGVNASWNDLTMDADVLTGAAGDVIFKKGDRLNTSPEYTVGILGNYTFPLHGKGLKGRVSTSANYTSDLCGATTTGPRCGDSMFIARASFSIDNAAHWSTTLYIDNLTNQQGIQVADLFPVRSIRIRPRTIGLQAEVRF